MIQSVDRDLPVFDLQTMDRWTMKSLASRRATMLLSLIFSTVALFLAAVGIYGVLAYVGWREFATGEKLHNKRRSDDV